MTYQEAKTRQLSEPDTIDTSLAAELEKNLPIKDLDHLEANRTLVLIIDSQRAFTNPDAWFATSFPPGGVSANRAMTTRIGTFAIEARRKGCRVFAIKFVQDLERMAELDPERLHMITEKGMVIDTPDGTKSAVVAAPGTDDTMLDFGNSGFVPTDVFEKCSRSVAKDPVIMKAITDSGCSNIVMIGMDSNVCIFESTEGLVNTLPNTALLIPVDVISCRPSAIQDTTTKYSGFPTDRVTFCHGENVLHALN